MALHEYLAEEVALDCAEGAVTRREALRRLMMLGLTAPAAAALLASCGSDGSDGDAERPGTAPPAPTSAAPTSAASSSAAVDPTSSSTAASTTNAETSTPPSSTDATAMDEEIRFSGPRSELIGVFARGSEPRGAVLVIHENRGLTAHIRTIPGRLAADGYAALAIDLLSEEGGTASLPSEGDATAALGNAPTERLIADLRAGLDELERRVPGVGLAAIGFCFGGGMTWQLLAAGEQRLSAAVPFYGPAPADADFSGSPDAAVLGVYAELDARVNASQETARAALQAAGLTHEIAVFPGVDHAFFNDTGQRYNADQAAAAYSRMLDWFSQHLSV